MEAFPAVLKKIPNARLVVAGANHHTKAGYWEAIRQAQPSHLPIEFRGYVPEEEIPELYRSTSIVVMPYDSATGSSGPAHQACEYGIPIVCADIPEFREMAADEGMAARFYKTGDASELADRLIEILESPELQVRMSRRNYSAGLQMNMASVVRSYLRWFELHKCKRAIVYGGEATLRRRLFKRHSMVRNYRPAWFSASVFSRKSREEGAAIRKPVTAKKHSEGDGYRGIPTLEG
jgi:glycosyltransferase involved in cell wall biosynthesis